MDTRDSCAGTVKEVSVSLPELDLTAGESFRIGPHVVTVLDIDGEQVTFRIENLETGEESLETMLPSLPR